MERNRINIRRTATIAFVSALVVCIATVAPAMANLPDENGYLGDDTKMNIYKYGEGGLTYTYGTPFYQCLWGKDSGGNSDTATYTIDLSSIPKEGIKEARLYVYWTWSLVDMCEKTTGSSSYRDYAAYPELKVELNDVEVGFDYAPGTNWIDHYTDSKNVSRVGLGWNETGYMSYNFPAGTNCSEIPLNLLASGNNVVNVTNVYPYQGPVAPSYCPPDPYISGSGRSYACIQGVGLLTVESDPSHTTRYYIAEGNDMTYAKWKSSTSTWTYGIMPNMTITNVTFPGTLPSWMGNAMLTTVVPAGGTIYNRLYFNSNPWDGLWNGIPDTNLAVNVTDVSAQLASSGNKAGFQNGLFSAPLTTERADRQMNAANALLVVKGEPANRVYLEPSDSGATHCNETIVQIYANATDMFQGGQINLTYNSSCANVTNFEHASMWSPPPMSVWTHYDGREWITFSKALPQVSGTVLIGNLTIHCEKPEYCKTPLHFVSTFEATSTTGCKLLNDTGKEVPGGVAWHDGTFMCQHLPDLVITEVRGEGNDTHYTVNYTIKNVGNMNATAGHYTNLTIEGVEMDTMQVPDLLKPGDEKEYKFDAVIARNASNPYDIITVCADYNATVMEVNETNNCKDGRYPAEVVISVVPELTVVQPQEQFDVKIHVDPKGQSIYGVQYYLKYNKSVVRAETQTKGPFLGPISDTIVVINNIDQVNGIVEYAETRKQDNSGVNVPDNVTTIHFIAIGARGATSTLDLFDVIIVDENKEKTLIKTNNGTVEINDNQLPIPIPVSKHRTNNVAKKYQSTAILCSCSYDPDYPDKGGNISYIRWAFGDGQYGTSEGLPVDNCTCKEHKYESWLWNYSIDTYDNFTALLTVTDDGCPELSNSTEFDVTVFIAGDADGDGEVNIIDAVWVGKHWREECNPTEPCAHCTVYLWDGAQVDGADLNNDCEINILDAVVVGANWRHVAW